MTTENKVKELEDELKLIKSELKQTLVSVRDFLSDVKVPPPPEEGDSPGRRGTSDVKLLNLSKSADKEKQPSQPPAAQKPDFEDSAESSSPKHHEPQPSAKSPTEAVPSPKQPAAEDVSANDEFPVDDDKTSQEDIPGEEESGMKNDSAKSPTSQVNLVANLIRWVSRAKKEIGIEQLPIFLDIYAVGSSLPQEMKEVILHLAEVAIDPASGAKTISPGEPVDEQIALCLEVNILSGQLPPEIRDNVRRLAELVLKQSIRLSKVDIWSQLLLELHGILSGEEVSLNRSLNNNLLNKKEEKTAMGIVGTGTQVYKQEAARLSLREDSPIDTPEEAEQNSAKRTGPGSSGLRLVMALQDGSERELDLGNLFISTDSSSKKGNGRGNISTYER